LIMLAVANQHPAGGDYRQRLIIRLPAKAGEGTLVLSLTRLGPGRNLQICVVFVFRTKQIFPEFSAVPLHNLDHKGNIDLCEFNSFGDEGFVVAFPKQILHTINNQLTIVLGRAALLASETTDTRMKKRCEEIESAAQKISCLLNCPPEGE